jgi:D-arabinose 1-dehydrogenase-like Zn-dependent alcohol dehydrogenase
MSDTVEFTVFRGSKEGRIVKGTTRHEVKPHDIVIKITHSRLCFSDTHFIRSGNVLGHEGVGIVERVGNEVTNFKVCVFS